MWSVARVVVIAAVLLAATACTSVIDGVPPLAMPPSPATAPATASISPGPSSVPPNGLTGYGATKTAFAAAHPEAKSSSPGCCYGPIVRYESGIPISAWNIANSPGDVIILLVHNFIPGTDATSALRRIETDDLPSDAQRIRSGPIDAGACYFAVYRSEKVSRALDVEVFSVRLFSPTTPGAAPRYVPTSIQQAKIITGDVANCVN